MTNRKTTFTLPKKYRFYFWDSDWDDLKAHTDKYRSFIISRLADKGDCEVVSWLKHQFSISELSDTISRSRLVSPKTRVFWEHYGRTVRTGSEK
jgi:hypothetical protein